jgi:Zn-dependent peptidase ImmA (M78 family)
MKKILFIIIPACLLFSSCTDFVDQRHFYVAPELKIFVNKFYAEATKRHLNLSHEMTMILTDDLNTVFTAVYGLTLYDLKEIKIDRRFTLKSLAQINSIDSLTIEFIVFHEMGHLILHRDHEPYPTYSIMTVEEQWLYDYQTDPEKRKILINELFKP